MGNGYVLSQFLNSAQFGGSRDTADSTTFKKKSKTYIPGLKDGNMSVEGVWEGELNLVDDILYAALGTGDGVFSYIPQGQEVVGNLAYSLTAIEVTYDINTAVGDIAQCSAELNAGSTGYGIVRGLVAHPQAAEAGAGNGVALDNGAAAGATTLGVGLVVHVFAAAAGSNIYIQDSADGVTWADLAGNIAIPVGRSSQHLFIPGTVRRYTRVRWTGAATFTALINRK
jgi:hypothetical protein